MDSILTRLNTPSIIHGLCFDTLELNNQLKVEGIKGCVTVKYRSRVPGISKMMIWHNDNQIALKFANNSVYHVGMSYSTPFYGT
ncbi:hypothetical protein T01_7498 [Trichinella spiralis]|uniref:Uncharacterized protein n=1 Tax=Trichinella spiralis TaxID=6334 RepID=A0A0V1BM49_TRISP|nr:hypothetical protein T01_7498 [Trichinella spiralis]